MNDLIRKSISYLHILCNGIPERGVGSPGNREATAFAAEVFRGLGWETVTPEFAAMDWRSAGAELRAGETDFEVFSSPYSLPCDCRGILRAAGSVSELEKADARHAVLLLHGELAREQLMPKNFVFYNPEEHQHIVALLENSGAAALVCATGRNSALAGGAYPFPLIEDGDFDIPSVYMTEEEGARLLPRAGETVHLRSDCERIPAAGYNVIARKGGLTGERTVIVTAHIDAKKGTPGAIDNATGVTVLFLLAELLKDYRGKHPLELLAFNGEDYYAVPGQMNFIASRNGDFSDILLNINIDGAGYREGGTAFSFFNLPDNLKMTAEKVTETYPGISEGMQWVQGDHSIFVQFGVPAIAVSSQWFLDNMETQDVTHTPKDNLSIVNPERLPEIARAIRDLILGLG